MLLKREFYCDERNVENNMTCTNSKSLFIIDYQIYFLKNNNTLKYVLTF